MKKTLFTILLLLLSVSICSADEDLMKKAYSYYYQGKMAQAIVLMQEASAGNPAPEQLYFIGYAYYKLKDFSNARKYFDEAYKLNNNYAPVKVKAKE